MHIGWRWLLLAGLALSGCTEAAPARQTVDVFAASSLTEAFTDLARGFEARHPDVEVRLSFAGSQVLRLQIAQGARAHVFASANREHMEALVADRLVSDVHAFARNQLVVIVPEDNPAGIERFEQLAQAERIVVGTEAVPVGRYARRALDAVDPALAAQIRARIVSEESNARLVRAKVELGEADAAIVYRTDATARVRVVPLPAGAPAEVGYTIAATRTAAGPAAAAFIAYVRSEPGQAALAARGFETRAP